MRRILFLIPVLSLLLSGCASFGMEKAEQTHLQKTTFAALPGWKADDVSRAVTPLKKSCVVLLKKNSESSAGAGGFSGEAKAWHDACRKIPASPKLARQYFETYFTPYALNGAHGREGLFTGYYEPILHGSYKKHGRYRYPLYARPRNLVTVDLGDFKPELKGQTVMGRVLMSKDEARLVPYYTRAQIDRGAIRNQKKIVWVNSAIDAFYLHIQGSGLVVMDNGKILHVGYAAQNGQPYTAIGRELIKRGALDKDHVSMQSIRVWLQKHPREAEKVMDVDASYVFFRKLGKKGTLGAEGVPLTPGRSLAVDSHKIPYGAPIWLDAESPNGKTRLQRLMVAQDTGGAIRGVVRGDFFWGAGAKAADNAGKMKSKGEDYILLPKSVTVPQAFLATSGGGLNP